MCMNASVCVCAWRVLTNIMLLYIRDLEVWDFCSGEPTPHRHQGTNAVQPKDDRINHFCPRLLRSILMVYHKEAIARAETGQALNIELKSEQHWWTKGLCASAELVRAGTITTEG